MNFLFYLFICKISIDENKPKTTTKSNPMNKVNPPKEKLTRREYYQSEKATN